MREEQDEEREAVRARDVELQARLGTEEPEPKNSHADQVDSGPAQRAQQPITRGESSLGTKPPSQ
jgi:hypothetical protein|eukprot:COSAG01_NODE_5133_length_4460_cov_4.745359_4_plen_65_part_00